MNNAYNHRNIYDLCEEHMHAYVLLEMKDGSQTDGIITGIDHENVYVAVPIEEERQQDMRSSNDQERQCGYGGFGGYGGGYGGYSGYPYGEYGGHDGHD